MTKVKMWGDPSIKVGDSSPEWINIGISYPELNVNVLLTDGQNIGFGYLVKNRRFFHWKSYQDLGWITHWMPLPELPSE